MCYWKLKPTITGNTKGELFIWMFQKKILIATALSNRKWSVQSQSKNVTYTINQITENCNCQLGQQKISFADLCEHIYSSNCAHKTKICKHICKVHSTLKIKIKQCKTDLKTNEKD